jgi:hypothetical protein
MAVEQNLRATIDSSMSTNFGVIFRGYPHGYLIMIECPGADLNPRELFLGIGFFISNFTWGGGWIFTYRKFIGECNLNNWESVRFSSNEINRIGNRPRSN